VGGVNKTSTSLGRGIKHSSNIGTTNKLNIRGFLKALKKDTKNNTTPSPSTASVLSNSKDNESLKTEKNTSYQINSSTTSMGATTVVDSYKRLTIEEHAAN